jgi:predicted lipoprotein with Yx(FWY)xxD motif
MPKRLVLGLLATALAAAPLSAAAPGARLGATAVARLKVAYNKKLKRSIVVDARGMTLYMFARETKGYSLCTPSRDRQCAEVWPALKTDDQPTAGRRISASLVGGAGWPDGTLQVAYNNHPLYYFHGGHGFAAGDRRPGQVRGQGIGALWWVLSPKGKPIKQIP